MARNKCPPVLRQFYRELIVAIDSLGSLDDTCSQMTQTIGRRRSSTLRIVCGLQSRINYASVGLRPYFVFGQIGVQPGEVKRGVDVLTFDVMFNLSKLLSESLAILVVLLNVAHALSLLLCD